MADKLITADLLEHFKEKQDIFNAQTFLTRIVYPNLPTEYNYAGRLAFVNDRLYTYTSTGWQKIPWFSEIGSGGAAVSPWNIDEDGNATINPISVAWNKDENGNIVLE